MPQQYICDGPECSTYFEQPALTVTSEPANASSRMTKRFCSIFCAQEWLKQYEWINNRFQRKRAGVTA
jgi:hypothetical protein